MLRKIDSIAIACNIWMRNLKDGIVDHLTSEEGSVVDTIIIIGCLAGAAAIAWAVIGPRLTNLANKTGQVMDNVDFN